MISVIIPTYNMRTTIEKTIRSVINQTVEPKIFVVDDGSNDGTMEVVSRYREITSLSYPENKGMSYAMNLAIDLIDTEHFIVIAADDIMLPDNIENWSKQELSDVNYCKSEFMTPTPPNGLKIRIETNMKNPKRIKHCHQFYTNDGRHIIDGMGCLCLRTESVKECGYYDENLRYKEGGELLIRMALEGYVFKYFDFIGGRMLSKGKSLEKEGNDLAIKYIKNKHR